MVIFHCYVSSPEGRHSNVGETVMARPFFSGTPLWHPSRVQRTGPGSQYAADGRQHTSAASLVDAL